MTTEKDSRSLALEDILALDLAQCDLAVCLAAVIDDETVPLYSVLDLSNKLTDGFRHIVTIALAEYSKAWHKHDLELHEYGLESKPDDYQVEHMDLFLHEEIQRQIKPLTGFQDLGTFQMGDASTSSLHFYVIIARPLHGDRAPIYFYRSYTPKNLLSQSRFLAAIWRGANEYDVVTEPVLLFDKHIDCFSRGNDMYIFKKEHFHHIFRFLEEVQKAAQETLHIIAAGHVRIQNFEQFASDCQKHPIKMLKLRNISKKPYLKTLTLDMIKRVLHHRELGNIGVEIVTVDGSQMLLYDAKKPWALLKLLDDDYLWSIMTDQSYEVTGKHELDNKQEPQN